MKVLNAKIHDKRRLNGFFHSHMREKHLQGLWYLYYAVQKDKLKSSSRVNGKIITL